MTSYNYRKILHLWKSGATGAVGHAFQCQEMQRDDDIPAETIGQILPAEQHHLGSSQQLYIPRGYYLQHPKLVKANIHLHQEGQLSFRIFTSEPQGLPTTTEKNRLHLPHSVTHRIWSSIMGPLLKEGHQPTRGRPKNSCSPKPYHHRTPPLLL